ncbi:MAG: dTMP kinase [Candidatus Sumerlaeaceae bacterium]|nr:dTMP kinase [Candidatus Sumerlaeaceae bacterium]
MTVPNLKTIAGGRLIAFEGIDGAGKTTQARRAVEALQQEGYDAVLLREPTDGPHGRRLREIMVAGRDQVDPMEELRLFLDDRRDDVERNIRPALDRGAIVCIDRYYISSIAYQGALGIDPVFIRRENESFAPVPDLILYFRLPVQQGLGRIAASRTTGQNLFERADYQERVRAIFESLDFDCLVPVDASATPDEVHEQVMRAIRGVLYRSVQKS